jgi:hypothetical protein
LALASVQSQKSIQATGQQQAVAVQTISMLSRASSSLLKQSESESAPQKQSESEIAPQKQSEPEIAPQKQPEIAPPKKRFAAAGGALKAAAAFKKINENKKSATIIQNRDLLNKIRLIGANESYCEPTVLTASVHHKNLGLEDETVPVTVQTGSMHEPHCITISA